MNVAPDLPKSALNPATRARALQALADERFDVIVIGAGVTGAGVALDAAARGLKVAVVDARDAASGTSQWSSKMVHGGLRYLATYQFGIARNSANERHALMTAIAPHLVRPRRNLLPRVSSMSAGDFRLTRVGLHLADGLRRAAGTPSSVLPGPGLESKRRTRELLPAWKPDDLGESATYWDGELEDDARLVLTLLRTAAVYGAQIATYTSAEVLGEHEVRLTDVVTGESFTAAADVVVAATGVWSAQMAEGLMIVPSRGTHLVVDAARVGNPEDVITIPVAGERGRYVFFKPAPDGLVYIGLTDEVAEDADGWAPGTPESEIQFLLDAASGVLADPLTRADLVGMFSGLRPLVAQEGKSAADTARDHVLVDEPGCPLVITGGKLTTYRAMAEETVDAVVARLDSSGKARRKAGPEIGPCVTKTLPLVGAAAAQVLESLPESARLVRRYGTLAGDVDALIAADPSLGERVGRTDVTLAELVYGITHEGAMTVDDVIGRRARLTMRSGDVDVSRDAAAEAFERASVEPFRGA